MWNKMVMWGGLRNTTMHILQVIQNSQPGPKIWPQSVRPSWAVILAVGGWTWLLGLPRPSFRTADETLLMWRHIQSHYTRVCVTDDGKWLSVTNRSREWQMWKACLSSKYCSKFNICIYLCLCLFTEHEISNLSMSWVCFAACSFEVLLFEELGFIAKEVLHVRRSSFHIRR